VVKLASSVSIADVVCAMIFGWASSCMGMGRSNASEPRKSGNVIKAILNKCVRDLDVVRRFSLSASGEHPCGARLGAV